jgi:hypothetical protein
VRMDVSLGIRRGGFCGDIGRHLVFNAHGLNIA